MTISQALIKIHEKWTAPPPRRKPPTPLPDVKRALGSPPKLPKREAGEERRKSRGSSIVGSAVGVALACSDESKEGGR